MVKSAYEISKIAKAAGLADRMFDHVPKFLSQAKTEMDLADMIKFYRRKQGHHNMIRFRGFNKELFHGHIMSGRNAALPSNSPKLTGGKGPGPFHPQGPSFDEIQPNQPLLIDYPVNLGNYLSDQSRIFVLGKLKDRFMKVHETMIRIQDSLAKKGRPGCRVGDLYELALGIVEENGLMEGFMGHPDPVPFIGHGIGLELDEWPIIGRNSDITLSEGMVISLEPKFVFPREGVVGIGNTFVVTMNGMKKLNTFPDEICTC